MVLDIEDILKEENDRYKKFLKSKQEEDSYDTRYIEETVNKTYDIYDYNKYYNMYQYIYIHTKYTHIYKIYTNMDLYTVLF